MLRRALLALIVALGPGAFPAWAAAGMAQGMDRPELAQLATYLRDAFGNPGIDVRPRNADSAEVYLGDRFLGLVYVDEDGDGQKTYDFEMAIFQSDLPETSK